MIAFDVIEKSTETETRYGRVVTANDIDQAASLAIETVADDRFVVAVIQQDEYETIVFQAAQSRDFSGIET